jgi:hypothetical protein
MFAADSDNADDPITSLYREAYHDATTGAYPQALAQVRASVLGTDGKTITAQSENDSSNNPITNLLPSALQFLRQKLGVSETVALVIVAGSLVVAGPFAALVVGMIIGGASKRNMNRVMKKRYGDTYTVDATIRPEEDVEAPEDDDDDDDDDNDDGDEDDKDK